MFYEAKSYKDFTLVKWPDCAGAKRKTHAFDSPVVRLTEIIMFLVYEKMQVALFLVTISGRFSI